MENKMEILQKIKNSNTVCVCVCVCVCVSCSNSICGIYPKKMKTLIQKDT